MRLGILQCDSVRDELQPRHGDYPDMFRRLLHGIDGEIEFRVYDLPRGEFPASPDPDSSGAGAEARAVR
jgi:hypothetical protein